MDKSIISSVRVTCPVHLILFNLITLRIFNGGQELWSFSLFSFHHINNDINLNESRNNGYITRNLAQSVTLFWFVFETCIVRISVGSSTILLEVLLQVRKLRNSILTFSPQYFQVHGKRLLFIIIWFVRLLAPRPLLAYCASLGW
jgi:hypothetical protein